MNAGDFRALLPLTILAAAAVVVMLEVAIRRSHRASAILAMAGLLAAFVSLWAAAAVSPRHATALLVVDGYALFYMGLILAAGMVFVPLAFAYFRKSDAEPQELYILMLVATLGSCVLVAAGHFVSFFLGLELLTVSLYGMIAYLRRRVLPVEAGVKYLILAALSSAFLLFGMALIYAALGTMEFAHIAAALRAGRYERLLVLPGMALIITGFGFKLAVVPFHLWTPDVYQGAPAPVTAYIATVSKGAMFALLLRYFYGMYGTGAQGFNPLYAVFSVMAIASMFAGNLLALLQDNVKRVLAYSSIAHLGYLLVAFLAAGRLGPMAVTFYLVAYFITTLGAFAVVAMLSSGLAEAESIEDYRGLFWRRPAVAAVFTAMLLSLAGIPATAGFIGKFYVVAAGASAARWALIVILVVTSSIGLYYYLRIVLALYARPAGRVIREVRASWMENAVLAVLTVLLIGFGIFPGPLVGWIRAALSGVA